MIVKEILRFTPEVQKTFGHEIHIAALQSSGRVCSSLNAEEFLGSFHEKLVYFLMQFSASRHIPQIHRYQHGRDHCACQEHDQLPA